MKNRSTTVCIATVIFLSVLTILLCFIAPVLLNYYYNYLRAASKTAAIVLTAFYICVPFSFIAYFLLLKLLLNIKRNMVFEKSNVTLLRFLSYDCFLAAIITAIFGFFYIPLFFVSAAAAFIGIILQVIKNVFSAAVIIKTENELTI